MKNIIIGIDISKEKLDLCVQISGKISQEAVISNTITDLKKFFKDLFKEHSRESVLLCAEYTGHYTYPLCCVCEDLELDLWLESPYHLKQSSGLQRGKNDKMDAKRIADYCNRYQDKARLFSLPDKCISSLRILITERDMYMSDKKKYQGQLTDQERFMSKEDYANKSMRLKRLMKELAECIAEIDKKIDDYIDKDEVLKNQHKLLCSIDGVGTKVATKMIVETNAFKDFMNGRAFCCHAGVAPFQYTSGSSVHSKNRVSHKADKSIKSLLHMASLSVATIKKDGELREFYLKKTL